MPRSWERSRCVPKGRPEEPGLRRRTAGHRGRMGGTATPRCLRVPERCYAKSPIGDELMSHAAAGITCSGFSSGRHCIGAGDSSLPRPALPCSASQAGSSRPPGQPIPPGLRQRQHRWRERGAGCVPPPSLATSRLRAVSPGGSGLTGCPARFQVLQGDP